MATKNGGTLYVLQARPPAIIALSPDGSHEVVIANLTRTPDGIKVDAENQVVYWTNMGSGIHLVDGDPASGAVPPNDGTIESANLNGSEHRVLVPSGMAGTPKELTLDNEAGHLYWCDREGMRVMRARLDGTEVTTLVRTGIFPEDTGDATRHCVGIVLDKANGHVYWTQKGAPDAGEGRIFRAALELPPGATPDQRPDVECLLAELPEPIDLDIDPTARMLYWTDRGDPPRGDTVSRAPLDSPAGRRKAPEIVFSHLMEGIGLALDLKGGRMFITDFAGTVYSANLDGSNKKTLLFAEGNLTGIAYVEI